MFVQLRYGIRFYNSRQISLTLFMDGGGQKSPLPKICHTYHKMVKLGTVIPYLKKIKKYINHMTHPLSSADISFFYRKSANFVLHLPVLIGPHMPSS